MAVDAAELATLTEDPERFPWQDGLPEHMAAALRPYRERLQATYSPQANVFELLRNRKSGWSIRGE